MSANQRGASGSLRALGLVTDSARNRDQSAATFFWKITKRHGRH